MVRESFLNKIFVLIVCIAIFHITATVFHFYWSIWWYDLPLHYLGGIFISLSSLWFLFFSGYVSFGVKKTSDFIIISFIVTFSVAVLWELFELIVGPDFTRQGYAVDTYVDLIMGIAGSLTGYLFFYFMKYEQLLMEH